MIRNAILTLAALSLTTAAAAATAPKGISLSQDKHEVFASRGTGHVTPPHAWHPSGSVIYSTLSTYVNGPYWAFEGYTLSGPTSPIGQQIWLGAAFTPASSATATEVDIPVGYVTGTNGIVVGIYSDSNGVPGTALWTGKVKNLQSFGGCCAISTAKIGGGLALSGGTQYWVTVTTNKKESDEWAAWTLTTTDQIDQATFALNEGSGWQASSALPGPAFAVIGQ